ncbi:MAG: YbaK/prolyl-tRNA synthetase associated region [Deltaproteobacteria bacterium]|jgi:Ala-tRNA(Pro) deacylase|nr:YbaK/prolyl-tRNA synthetase associated region [Deltaproteobacteria bacterium]
MPILTKLRDYLDRSAVGYEVISHRQAFTAQEVAQAEHISGKELAKVVMLRSGKHFSMVVLPAPLRVDLDKAKAAMQMPDLVLATEDEFAGLFPQCEPGAMPPFGNLYDLPVYVDESLTKDESIVFNAGNHTQTVRMQYADFARLVQPTIVAVAAKH